MCLFSQIDAKCWGDTGIIDFYDVKDRQNLKHLCAVSVKMFLFRLKDQSGRSNSLHFFEFQPWRHRCSPGSRNCSRGVCRACRACPWNIVRSCRDIGEMQWNRVSSRPSWYRTCFGPGIIHCVHFFFDWFQFVNISNPKLCLRTFVWKWGHTRHHGTGLICYVKLRSRVFSFEVKEQMLRIGLCVIHFFASDVNAWTRYVSLNRCEVCRSSCGGNIETLRFQLIFL